MAILESPFYIVSGADREVGGSEIHGLLSLLCDENTTDEDVDLIALEGGDGGGKRVMFEFHRATRIAAKTLEHCESASKASLTELYPILTMLLMEERWRS